MGNIVAASFMPMPEAVAYTSAVGGTQPNATVPGYHHQDLNMDGTVKFTGSGNDRDRVTLTVGGSTPNAVRTGQLP